MIRISYRRVICHDEGTTKLHLSTMHTPLPGALA
jgi:hypothetical protein